MAHTGHCRLTVFEYRVFLKRERTERKRCLLKLHYKEGNTSTQKRNEQGFYWKETHDCKKSFKFGYIFFNNNVCVKIWSQVFWFQFLCLLFDCSRSHPALPVTLATTSAQCGPGENPRIYIYDQASMLLLKVIAFFLYRKHAGLETQMQKIAECEGRVALPSSTDLVPRPLRMEAQTVSLILPQRFMATSSKLIIIHHHNSTGTSFTHTDANLTQMLTTEAAFCRKRAENICCRLSKMNIIVRKDWTNHSAPSAPLWDHAQATEHVLSACLHSSSLH